MGERRALVIGSQCGALNHLPFLPAGAEALYEMLTDPAAGNCISALRGRAGLVLNPTVDQMVDVISEAFKRTSEDEATLVFAYIGHGHSERDAFYLLPFDGSIEGLLSRSAVQFARLIEELHARHSSIDGLLVLLDACYSGQGAVEAAARWIGPLREQLRFEVLSASEADRTVADGCFSRALVDLVRLGLTEAVSEYVRCEQIRPLIAQGCRSLPQNPTHNSGIDAGLYVARNAAWAARSRTWMSAVTAQEIGRLTAWFQPTPLLEAVVTATQSNRCVVLRGLAGTGKSTIAAALARPEAAGGRVPDGFVHAIAFISQATTSVALAMDLSAQLRQNFREFSVAQQVFWQDLTLDERNRLDAVQREVIGPLRHLRGAPVRIVIDGLDQLADSAERTARSAIDALASDPTLSSVRLVVTSRPDIDSPPSIVLSAAEATPLEVKAYLARRDVPVELQGAIMDTAKGNWLVASLLADLAIQDLHLGEDRTRNTLVAVYDQMLRLAGAGTIQRFRARLRPVLAVLAAAGVGPILPLRLLCVASAKLGGPERPSGVRDVLVDLRGLVARGSPGSDAEQVGLFHDTLAAYLFGTLPGGAFRIDMEDPHRALAQAIDELAPMTAHDSRDPLHRYAAAREAEHVWLIGAYDAALNSLKAREEPAPAENLKRWLSWNTRISAELGHDHPATLTARGNIAGWTGRVGDMHEALALFRALLPDRERLLGAEHRDTLLTRQNVALWTGETGDEREALRLFRELLLVQLRAVGPDDPTTLTTRHNIALLIGQTGDAREALRLFRELLSDRQRVLGPSDPATFASRHNVAYWTGRTGDAHEALRLFQELLQDRERHFGPDNPDTLVTRLNVALWTGQDGEAEEAGRLFAELLPDEERVLGPSHPQTLVVRGNMAHWTGQTGNAQEALRLWRGLLPDQERVLGSNHRETLAARSAIAHWVGQTGDAREALRLFRELLPDQERVLGPSDPDTHGTRRAMVHWGKSNS